MQVSGTNFKNEQKMFFFFRPKAKMCQPLTSILKQIK